MSLSPIVVLTYNRPGKARRLFEALLANPEALESRMYVYSDGPRSEADRPLVEATRAVIRSLAIPRLELVERASNVGLARNVIEATSAACAKHGSAIVLEDDLLVSPTFLAFMNAALDRYCHHPSVMHVSGYMFSLAPPRGVDVLFLPFINSWGWATWDRAWRCFDSTANGYALLAADRALRRRFDLDGHYYFYEMLQGCLQGRIQSWAIRWYLSVFLAGGLAAFPAKSLVENCGFDEMGTNTRFGPPPPHVRSRANPFRVREFPDPFVDPVLLRRIQRLHARESSLQRVVRNKVRATWRRVIGRASRDIAS